MWLLFSQLTAFFEATRNITAKNATKKFNPIIVTWAWVLFSLIILIPLQLLFSNVPVLTIKFWTPFALNIVIITLALLAYTEALKLSDMSVTAPMLTFTPIVTLISSIFVNQEYPSALGIIGIIIVIIGSYFLNFDWKLRDPLLPFKNVYKDKGILLMLVAAILLGLMSTFAKYAIENSNIIFYTTSVAVGICIVFIPISLISARNQFLSVIKVQNMKSLVPVGLLDGTQILLRMITISSVNTAYAAAATQTVVIFSAIFGYFFFKEKISSRIIPTLIMLLGVIVIALSQ